jgi:hypothetical protein
MLKIKGLKAYYLAGNWKKAAGTGLGKAENSIGGFTFQFSDGWWKQLKLKFHES